MKSKLKYISGLLCIFVKLANCNVVLLGHRLCKEIALYPVAAAGTQESKLFLCFNALCNGSHMQAVGKIENTLKNYTLLFVLAVLTEQGLVYFQYISRHVLDELQRRKPASEVVDSYSEACFSCGIYPFKYLLCVVDHC